jgi:hypothetical protein
MRKMVRGEVKLDTQEYTDALDTFQQHAIDSPDQNEQQKLEDELQNNTMPKYFSFLG